GLLKFLHATEPPDIHVPAAPPTSRNKAPTLTGPTDGESVNLSESLDRGFDRSPEMDIDSPLDTHQHTFSYRPRGVAVGNLHSHRKTRTSNPAPNHQTVCPLNH